MKKTIVLILVICMLFTFMGGCSSKNTTQPNNKTNADGTPIVEGTGNKIKMFRYTWSDFLGDGYIHGKSLYDDCAAFYRIVNALENLEETGEVAEKILDDPAAEQKYFGEPEYMGTISWIQRSFREPLPIDNRIMWIEMSGNIYRLSPNLSQICIVETHFGEGRMLEMTDELKADLNAAWNYAPYNYYLGEYSYSSDTLEMDHVFEANSTVKVNVKDIYLENVFHSENNKITVELISTVDQEVKVHVESWQSEDNLGSNETKTVTLKKNKPTVVEFEFFGFYDFGYRLSIKADNTKVEMSIWP